MDWLSVLAYGVVALVVAVISVRVGTAGAVALLPCDMHMHTCLLRRAHHHSVCVALPSNRVPRGFCEVNAVKVCVLC